MEENFYEFTISSPLWAGLSQENPASRDAFLQRFIALTPSQKDVLASVRTAETISRICRGANLTGNQMEFIAIVVREVVTGLAQQSDIAPLIMEHLQLDPGPAGTIAHQLWDEVLSARTAPSPEDIPPQEAGVRQLNRRSPGQERGSDHIINLREEE